MIIQKKTAQPVTACCLGEGSDLEKALTEKNMLNRRPDGSWEVHTRESAGHRGEIAQTGDYVKLDVEGCPYPVEASVFLREHRRAKDGYWQIPRKLEAWTADEPRTPILEWLLSTGRLKIAQNDPAHFYQAQLWGTQISAPVDAVLVFYHVSRNTDGDIMDVDFNFVDHEVFLLSYDTITQTTVENNGRQ